MRSRNAVFTAALARKAPNTSTDSIVEASMLGPDRVTIPNTGICR
jgi:hypothetical protein